MKIYLVQEDWQTSDYDGDYEIWAFAKYEDALKKYKDIIESETDPDGWLGEAFDENGELNKEDYTLEQSEHENGNMFWSLYPSGFYTETHCTVKLTVNELL